MVVSRKLISLSDISAVNLIEGWCLFARAMNLSISLLSVLHNEKISSMYLFHSRGLVLLKFRISVSTTEMKIDVSKGDCHLYTHCGSVCFFTWLRKFSSIHSRNVGCKLMWDDIAHSCYDQVSKQDIRWLVPYDLIYGPKFWPIEVTYFFEVFRWQVFISQNRSQSQHY